MMDETDLAFAVVDKVIPKSEPQAMRSAFIPIILQILAALAPMILECLEGDEAPQKITKLCDCNGFVRRLRMWRVMRIVRNEMGPDASWRVVRKVTDGIFELGTDVSYTHAYTREYL